MSYVLFFTCTAYLLGIEVQLGYWPPTLYSYLRTSTFEHNYDLEDNIHNIWIETKNVLSHTTLSRMYTHMYLDVCIMFKFSLFSINQSQLLKITDYNKYHKNKLKLRVIWGNVVLWVLWTVKLRSRLRQGNKVNMASNAKIKLVTPFSTYRMNNL